MHTFFFENPRFLVNPLPLCFVETCVTKSGREKSDTVGRVEKGYISCDGIPFTSTCMPMQEDT